MPKCRCCGAKLLSAPLLEYKNMPGRAQHFPDKEHLSEDKGVDLRIYQCEGCGLIQLADEPVSYYRDVIRATSVSDEMRRFRIEQFSGFLEEYDLTDKKIVEIGCGNGEFMRFMEAAGGEVYGIENNPEAVKRCREEGLKVQKGFPEDEKLIISDGPFDAFYIMNFLEHIPDPRDFLFSIGRNLKDGAYGLIEVPNMDMIIKNMLFSEFMLDHLMYFTSDTLTRLLEISGFEVIKCESVWHDYCLSAVVKKRTKLSLDAFTYMQEELCNEINSYIDGFRDEGKKVAVWGAGHQALAVLELAGIRDKLEYVVDSADFKQNKYTPGSHIPVVSPEKLKSDPVDAIIVMAASYSDEVKKLIDDRYKGVKTAILREKRLEICK